MKTLKDIEKALTEGGMRHEHVKGVAEEIAKFHNKKMLMKALQAKINK